eukprot:scaffold148723_cov15-Tisochrysis_lutea.AAC.1
MQSLAMLVMQRCCAPIGHRAPEPAAACASLDPSYKPAITFVVVQKRHNTRLLPTREGPNEKGNIMPGTVVDRMICNPFEFDFYLNS